MLYEVRCYTLQAGRLPEYLALVAGEKGVLDVLLPNMCGFWCAESGPLNTVHHLWRYENRTARAAARAAMLTNAAMLGFVPKARPLMLAQTSRIMAGEVGVDNGARTGGVYDRIALRFRSGARADRCESLLAALRAALSGHFEGVAWLRGVVFELAGPPRDGLFVLRSASLDERDRNWAKASAALREFDVDGLLASVDSELMLPTVFSPWR